MTMSIELFEKTCVLCKKVSDNKLDYDFNLQAPVCKCCNNSVKMMEIEEYFSKLDI